jgi:hypothetical protein
METLIIIVAFWLIVVGIYGALPLVRGVAHGPARGAPRVSRSPLASISSFSLPHRQESRPAVQRQTERIPSPSLFSELDMLRAQVEHLRSQLVALSSASSREERARHRRYRSGPYAELPRPLRRQVHEVRSVRHPLQRA